MTIHQIRHLAVAAAAVLVLPCFHTLAAQHYYAYVAAESEDQVSLLHFDGTNLQVVQNVTVGVWPAEIEGPHGIAVSPDGEYWYVSVAHGNPFGTVYKYETVTNELAGRVELGLFPATMSISPTTGLLYVANFNLHGDMEPSTVSIVDPVSMTELGRTRTGIMPHGGRFSADGLRHYSVSMMDGMLHELDAVTFDVRRSLALDHAGAHANAVAHSMTKPTWASPHPTRRVAYVAGNGSAKVLEVDLDSWAIAREFETAKGPYNLDVSPDGRWLVVTHKGAASTGIWSLLTNEQVAVIQNTRTVTHGVAITGDSRYAFVSVEGVGSEPGTVDVIDLSSRALVATADVGKQAGGIAHWKQTSEAISLPSRK